MDKPPILNSEKIKEMRAKRNLSQEALAKLLGVSTSTVIRWEQGAAIPTGTAATILLAMLAGPFVVPVGFAAIAAAPWALSAYGIYRVLKDVFEHDEPEQQESKRPPPHTNE
jgi:transcriptional regulator with XRE-family HTH domain